MKRRSRELEIFTLSFLDIISCGFGAVVLLILLSRSTTTGGTIDTDRIAQQFRALAQAETTRSGLDARTERLTSELGAQTDREAELQKAIEQAKRTLAALQSTNSGLSEKIAALHENKPPPAATLNTDDNAEEKIYAGGIPVDANHVIFIVDTSGSMQSIWAKVMQQMENILDTHPKVKGFQIMNDNGIHIISAYKNKWINDTPGLRKRVLKILQSWQAFSNSSPVEGLEAALRLYVKTGMKTSIYILGDDYTGSSYGPVLKTIARLNTNKITGEPIARIHGIGFYNRQGGDIMRLSTLMREVARQSRGTFIALD